MPESAFDETRATAQLGTVDIEIVHRRARDGNAEELALRLSAVPSFAALEPLFLAANPWLFWSRAMELAWSPWLGLPPPGGRR